MVFEHGLAALPNQAELLRARAELSARFFSQPAVTLRYGDVRVRVVGALPLELGREGLFPLRGPGISCRHVRMDRRGAKIWVEDLDSRNGTTVDGLLLEAGVELGGAARLGLGESLHVRVGPSPKGLELEVLDGLDRGLCGLIGLDTVKLPKLPARFAFPEGYPTLIPDAGSSAKLDGRDVVTPIELLIDDRVELGGEVLELQE